jgi:hypothetical protein
VNDDREELSAKTELCNFLMIEIMFLRSKLNARF